MKNGCDFCNDLRNIEPAKYIGGGDDDFKKWIAIARVEKKFIQHVPEGLLKVTECPVCHHTFTDEDYDSYI